MAPDTGGYRDVAGDRAAGGDGGAVTMDDDLQRVIRQALYDARAAGRDHLTQTEEAVRAVLQERPDMTASEALTAVDLVRRVQSYRR